jgi:hypothetical protein
MPAKAGIQAWWGGGGWNLDSGLRRNDEKEIALALNVTYGNLYAL